MGQSSYKSQSVREHKTNAPVSVTCAVVTVSDTRTLGEDKSGALVARLLEEAGHVVANRTVTPDEPDQIRDLVMGYVDRDDIKAVLVTGGTGISTRDQTFETITSLLTKPMTGYGELFRMLSYKEIGAAAMLSRAIGGLVARTAVLTMPGSTAAVRLAMEQLILPELGHLVREATK